MYSVVLAVALTAAPAQTGWRQNGCICAKACQMPYCSGAYCGFAGPGMYPGYPHGCVGGGFVAPHPASPEVHYYGGAGAGYGYHGGCYGAGYAANYYFDPSMHGCTGCYGAHGGHSGYGIPVPPPTDPRPSREPVDPFPPIKDPETKKQPPVDGEDLPAPKEIQKKSSVAPVQPRAVVRVDVPKGGKLYVDGKRLNVAAGMHHFQTPVLAKGQQFFYQMKIEVEVAGILRKDEQRVIVERGQDVVVDFPSLRAVDTARQK